MTESGHMLTHLHNEASNFTELLTLVIQENTELAIPLGGFPRGGCDTSSRLFGVFLSGKAIQTTLVHGRRKKELSTKSKINPDQEHVWLVWESPEVSAPRCLVDLTCVQFEECGLPCPYVSSDFTWHDQIWEIVTEIPISKLEHLGGEVHGVDVLNIIRKR